MSSYSEARRNRVVALGIALSLLSVSLNAGAMSISPSPSYTGNYSVSWGPTGCQPTGAPYPYPPYVCSALYENGNMVSQNSPYSVAGKATGTYQYQVVVDYIFFQEPVDSGSVIVGTPPPLDPLSTQLNYQYRTRAGDINGDGRTDLFVKRASGGVSGNGVLESAILRQNTSGGTFTLYVPSASQSSIASGWPLSSASAIVADFNVDGFVDVEVKGIAAATGVASDDQIIYSSAVPLQPQPLGLRAVDDSLRQFVGNSADYFVNPDYFTENATYHYFSGAYVYYSCTEYYGVLEDAYYGIWPCSISYVPIYGYYWDYSAFSEEAVAVWMTEEAYEAGSIGAAESTEAAQEATEAVLEVGIGGWDFPNDDDDLDDPDKRRGLETFLAIFGILKANAQEVDTDEADVSPRQPNLVYVTGHNWLGIPGLRHTALEYRDGPTDNYATTISASRINGKLVARYNRETDHPLTAANQTIGVVGSLSYPSAPLLFSAMETGKNNYDDDLTYCGLPSTGANCYNSNGFSRGLVEHTNGAVTWATLDVDEWTDVPGGNNPVPSSQFN